MYVHIHVTTCNIIDNADDGYALIKDMSPSSPSEYILKAVALTLVGQEHNSVIKTKQHVYM